jgi:hypothetical protein
MAINPIGTMVVACLLFWLMIQMAGRRRLGGVGSDGKTNVIGFIMGLMLGLAAGAFHVAGPISAVTNRRPVRSSKALLMVFSK